MSMMTESAKVDMIMQGLRTHDYVRVIDGLRPDSVFRFNPSEQPFLDLYIEDPNDFMRLLKLSIYKTLAEKRGNLQLITSGYKDLRVKIVSEDVISMHDINSNPAKEFLRAKLETFLSKAEAPAIKVVGSNKDIREKDGPNLIMIPSKPPSLIKVLDPAPKTFILLFLLISFKKKDNSFNFFGLNKTFAGPPKLNHECFERFSCNEILPDILFFKFSIYCVEIIEVESQFLLSNLKYFQLPCILLFHYLINFF